MSVKQHGQRVVILVIVALFFLSSLAAGVAVIIDAVKNDGNKKSADTNSQSDIQKQLEELQKQQNQEGKLQGTKLENYTPIAKIDTLQVQDIVPGNGAEAKADSTVVAHYTGALAKDGTIFESSKDRGQPAEFPLSNVIKGWQQGVPGMKVGGKRRLLIPASLAYGAQASDKIPANSDLVFDIELQQVK